MTYKKDKYSEYDRELRNKNDATTRIYTTKDGNPFNYSEFKTAVGLYKQEFGQPLTALVPTLSRLPHLKREIEKEFELTVKEMAIRPDSIQLMQT